MEKEKKKEEEEKKMKKEKEEMRRVRKERGLCYPRQSRPASPSDRNT